MLIVTKVKTFDGILHDDTKAANRHLDRLYGDALSQLAYKIVSTNFKYYATMDVLDSNLHIFEYILKVKADMVIENNDE